MYESDNPMIKSEPGVLSGAGGAEAQERALSPPCTSPCTPFPDFSPFPPGLPATAADPDFCLSGVSAADNMWPDAYEPLQLSRPPEPTIEVESAAWEASQTAASLEYKATIKLEKLLPKKKRKWTTETKRRQKRMTEERMDGIYRELHERVGSLKMQPDATLDATTLMHQFSDKDLRILMKRNNLMINDYNLDTGRYCEMTKMRKVLVLLPLTLGDALLLPIDDNPHDQSDED